MTPNKSNVVVLVLAGALILAGLVIAFLVGHLWSTPVPPSSTPAAGMQPVPAVVQTAGEKPPVQAVGAGAAAELAGAEPGKGTNVLTDNVPRGGKIIEKDGQVLILGQGKPGPEKPVSPVSAAVQAHPAQQIAAASDSAERERREVQEYLNKVALLQAGPGGISPRKYSESLSDSLAKGQLGDFDKLVDDVKRVESDAKAISAPKPCTELHERLIGSITESREMMEEIRDALARNDMDRLQVLSPRAQALQAKVQAVEGMMEKMRRQYGVY